MTEAEFPDASLGVPEPGAVYAQVITPGYVIDLTAAGQTYRYHAAGERVVAVPDETSQLPGDQTSFQGAVARMD